MHAKKNDYKTHRVSCKTTLNFVCTAALIVQIEGKHSSKWSFKFLSGHIFARWCSVKIPLCIYVLIMGKLFTSWYSFCLRTVFKWHLTFPNFRKHSILLYPWHQRRPEKDLRALDKDYSLMMTVFLPGVQDGNSVLVFIMIKSMRHTQGNFLNEIASLEKVITVIV